MYKFVITAIILIGASMPLWAQPATTPKLGNFKIHVETVGDDIKLTCIEGCAFTELKFPKSNTNQAVDYFGMTTSMGTQGAKAEAVPYFLFTVNRSASGISLSGKKGTAWEDLQFGCRLECHQWIDESGTAKK